MKRSLFFEGLLVAAFLLLQSYSGQAAWFNFSKSLEGTVQEIHANLLTIIQSPPTEAGMAKVEVEINEETKYKEMASAKELKKGDAVEVKYKEEDGKKVALEIAKVLPTEIPSSVDRATTR